MKITTYCPICSRESEIEGGVTPEKGGRAAWPVKPNHLAINDDFIYTYKCFRGHEITMLLMNFKFEIIFDSGLNALHDGYLREAVTSFYASLEYFYKELTKYFMFLLNANFKEDQYCEFKKSIKLSEHSLASFHTTYYLAMRSAAPTLPNNLKEFRSKIVHGSSYPSAEETIKFGNNIKNYILTILELVEEKYDYSDWQNVVIENCPVYSNRPKINFWGYAYLLSKNFRINHDLRNTCITDYKPFWQLTKANI